MLTFFAVQRCEGKILQVILYLELEACLHFEKLNCNILLESCVNQKIPLTAKTLISLEQIIIKLFYLTLALISLFYSHISLILSTGFFLPEKNFHKM